MTISTTRHTPPGKVLLICFLLMSGFGPLFPRAHGEDAPGESAKPVPAAPTPPQGPVKGARVFYFGHSLVGHDLPQMIGAFARARGKSYAVQGQVGWGTPLMSHSRWDGAFDGASVPLGFPEELPGTLLFREDGRKALTSGKYDAVIFTETNGFAQGQPGAWKLDCDPSHPFGGCTVEHLGKLMTLARQHNPRVRTFLYTNWKDFKELGGIEPWLADIRDHRGWWEHVAERVEAELQASGARGPALAVIPAATVLAEIVEQARAGELAAYGLPDHAPLFSDTVHLTRLGFYIIAVTHYAALYRESPVGLPHTVDVVSGDKRTVEKDGFSLDPRLAAHIQREAWDVLKSYPLARVTEEKPR